MARARNPLRRILKLLLALVVGFYALVALSILMLRWVSPVTTAVQLERHVQSWSQPGLYHKEYTFVPMSQIAPVLQHAVVAAEDARFFQHNGFDWVEVEIAVNERKEKGRRRGASTITQQLVKNLFLTTSSTWVRKGVETTLVPVTEFLLPKSRILELYLNVIEWGPGIYGAEAAARHYYRIPARRLSRQQALDLATVIPSPLRRKPGRWAEYAEIIAGRMAQMGW